jgi:methyltransferase (TIGR00027 family)
MSAPETWDIASGPGLTALGLAASRLVESGRPDRLVDDPLAAAFLDAIDSPVPFPVRWPAPEETPSDQQALHLHGSRYIGLRTRFYDDFLRSAVIDGIRQVVVLAAGLDTRAFRLPLPSDLRLYELDQPQLLDFKNRVLDGRSERPVCVRRTVGADLRSDWSDQMLRQGFDPSQPTAWIAEGLLAYLPADAEHRLTQQIDDLSAPTSQLAADRILDIDRLAAHTAPLDRLSERSGLEMRSMINTQVRPALPSLLRQLNWNVEDRTTRDLAQRYGRDLADPFTDTEDKPAEPPWLNTNYLHAKRTHNTS